MNAGCEGYMGNQVLPALLRHKHGELYSVHRDSFYCLMGEGIILVHDSIYGHIPFGISVNGLALLLLDKDMHIGTPIYYKGFCLKVGSSLELCLRKPADAAILPKHLLPRSSFCLNICFIQEQLEKKRKGDSPVGSAFSLEELLRRKSRASEGDHTGMDHFSKHVRRRLTELADAICNNNYPQIKVMLDRSIGLGAGLTPTVDDVLVGLLSTFHYAAKKLGAEIKSFPSICQWVLTRSSRTNRVSRAYLDSAARGETFSLIDELLEAAYFGPMMLLRRQVERLLSVGSGSGAEMLLGILLGLRITIPKNNEVKVNV